MLNQYHYDAFISYRHTDLDKFVAENLHKQLEAFRMPRNVSRKRNGEKNRIERVFRDKDELPLTSNLEDPIIQALQNSEWLIVICSPRLRESTWCKKEIKTFVALRGREHVLAVLIEGEPAESFPDELLFRVEKQTRPDGSVEEVRVPVEPLAADVRGKDKREILKNMKAEVLRILAAMFQVPYDDLRQRHRERRMRRILTVSVVGGAAGLVFGAYCGATALRISNQNKQIEKQSQEIAAQNEKLAVNQALNLSESAIRYLDEGDQETAIQNAYAALTEVDGIAMPYTAQAQYALAESMGVYYNGSVYKADFQFETMGIIKGIKVSSDGSRMGICDDTGTLTILNVADQKVLLQLSSDEVRADAGKGYVFLPDSRLAYIDSSFQATIYNLESGQVEQILPTEQAFGFYADQSGNYFAVETLLSNAYEVYDGHTLQQLGVMPTTSNMGIADGLYFHESGIVARVSSYSGSTTQNIVYFIDLKKMEIISTCFLPNQSVDYVVMDENRAYTVSHYLNADIYKYKTVIMSVNLADGETLWQTELDGHRGEKLVLPGTPDSRKMLLLTNTALCLVDMESGEMGSMSFQEPEVVRVYSLKSNNGFYVFCQDGSWIGMNPNVDFAMNYSYMFDCRTIGNQSIEFCNGGIAVLATNDNRVTFYTAQTGPDVVESTHTIPEREGLIIDGDKVAEIVRSYNLDNPDFVKSGFYSEDKQYFFINYWDGDLVIYDTKTGTVAATLEGLDGVNGYLGKDHNGYTYISGPGHGYVLNESMELFLHIPDLADVDLQNDKVYIQENSTVYEAPLYTVEELLKLAESSVNK